MGFAESLLMRKLYLLDDYPTRLVEGLRFAVRVMRFARCVRMPSARLRDHAAERIDRLCRISARGTPKVGTSTSGYKRSGDTAGAEPLDGAACS